MSEMAEKSSVMGRLAEATPPTLGRRLRGLSDRGIAWLFIAPTMVLLLAINIFPLIWAVLLSFTNYRARTGRTRRCAGWACISIRTS